MLDQFDDDGTEVIDEDEDNVVDSNNNDSVTSLMEMTL